MTAIRVGDTVTVHFDAPVVQTGGSWTQVQTPSGTSIFVDTPTVTLKQAGIAPGDVVTQGNNPNGMTVLAINGSDVWVRKNDNSTQVLPRNSLTRV